ncbi:MAG: hypothetical protein H7A25_20310 [Leptospiraceae bacterium]|nr:hypothetical protein [Leptospiraceae bacterium]MCP5502250.1 hypothetical protein [Leptospiraceae bacterium]
MKNLLKIIFFFFVIYAIDNIIFDYVIWRLPNESPWNTNHFFNFIYEYKRIKRVREQKPLILLVGSSIAHFSLDRKLLEDYIFRKTGRQYRIEFLSYAGMVPIDSYLLFSEINALNPELILYPINFIDYKLHRAYLVAPGLNNETAPFPLMIQDALRYVEAPQSKFAFPLKTLTEFYSILGMEENAQYLASGLFSFYRYREIFAKNLIHLYNHRFGKNTSYHGYMGVQIPERVDSLGWTGKVFSFLPKSYMFRDGFYIQVVPEILKNGALEISFEGKEGNVYKLRFTKSGWKRVVLPTSLKNHTSYIRAELSSTWVPYKASGSLFDYSYDEMGVRLQQTFGTEIARRGLQYKREERKEDLRYKNMTENEYKKYFTFRLLKDPERRPGIAYLYDIYTAKKRLNKEKFKPTIHFHYLKEFIKKAKGNNRNMLLINNPENPVSLEWYESSDWYKGHLQFLESLEGDSVRFVDFHRKLPMQAFSDFHHITYPALIEMNPFYGDEIIRSLNLKPLSD